MQQLGRYGHGNHFGRLARNAGHADGAGHLRQLGFGKAALVQAVAERGPLAAAADQPDEGQVAAFALAAQAGGHHVQVLGMAEAHDEHARARRQARHGGLHGVGMLASHARRHIGRKDAVAAVDPGERKRQRRQHARQRLAHMAAAEQRHRHLPWRQARRKRRRIGLGDLLVAQVHHATAALPQAGAQRIAQHGRARPARKPATGLGNGLELDMAAADGAHHGIGRHRHPGATLARCGAFGLLHGHQAGRGLFECLAQMVQKCAATGHCPPPHPWTPNLRNAAPSAATGCWQA